MTSSPKSRLGRIGKKREKIDRDEREAIADEAIGRARRELDKARFEANKEYKEALDEATKKRNEKRLEAEAEYLEKRKLIYRGEV